jgi:RsiW-degrading membrane proteinase PrsW (M82 family)
MALLLIVLVFLLLAVGFARYLVKRDRGEREPIKALWAAFGFGLLAVPIAIVLELVLLPGVSDGDLAGYSTATLVLVSLGIGLIEELAKSLPLAWFIYKKRYFNEHTDGVIYFALAGLGFGLPENVLYTLENGSHTGLIRMLMTPFFHAATTSLIGYALARRKLDKWGPIKLVSVVVLAVILHGLYDFGLLSGHGLLAYISLLITSSLAIGVFVLYMHTQGLDQLSGLSAVGNNSFCRTCGHPNPKHNLYCPQCGNRA